MNASWHFADCANAIKGDLVSRGAFTPAHIRENNRPSQSTLVSPTRLADRASMRDSITLDAVRVLVTSSVYGKERTKFRRHSLEERIRRLNHSARARDGPEFFTVVSTVG
jgi:hypothetical protein